MKFIFTCGGTAGHINPALAVASRLKNKVDNAQFLFIGAENMMEMELVPEEGYEIRPLHITNISRSHSLDGIVHNIDTAKNVVVSVQNSKKIIKEFKPDAVIGTGGYVCFPVITAAHELGIPTIIHESNASPGLTTRMLAKFVDRILVGVEGCAHHYPDPDKVKVTGTPVRDDFSKYTRETARAELGIDENVPVVLSVWGSLGAQYMNDIISDMLKDISEDRKFKLIHATGSRYYDSFMEKSNAMGIDDMSFIDIYKYIHDMPRLMAAADLILCRAGASTLSELCYIGKPAILVPSPNVTDNHQEKNARVLENAGGAYIMLEGQFDSESLYNKICDLVADKDKLEKMSENMRTLSYDDSADMIADEILSIVSDER